MRFGTNPYKYDSRPVEAPQDVMVAVLVFIPHLYGYFEQRLDILKLSISSLVHHTEVPYELMVFDNGSCPEVVEYLLGLYDQGIVRYLLLSSHNVLKTGAYNMIFSAAPGKYVAFSDDDMFFHPGWLSATFKVFDAFPKAGMVTAQPTWDNFGVRNANTLAEAQQDSEIVIRRLEEWPQEWIEDYVDSIGSTMEQYLMDCRDKEIILLERNGTQAYATCIHQQFVCPKPLAMSVLPVPLGTRLLDDVEFDERLDRAGVMRLSTAQRYTQHMGNQLSPCIREVALRYGLTDELPAVGRERLAYAPPRLFRPFLRWMLKRPLPYKISYRAYHELFQLISWRAAEEKQERARALKTRKS